MSPWIIVILVLIVYWLGLKTIASVIKRIGTERNVHIMRTQYISRTINSLWTIAALVVISLVTGWGYGDMGIFLSSTVALLGISLFAQWSILSNVTASIMIFFFFPFRVGNWVEIIDGENSIEGEVSEITLFHIVIKGADNKVYTYPNSMVFQKAVSIQKEPPKKTPEEPEVKEIAKVEKAVTRKARNKT